MNSWSLSNFIIYLVVCKVASTFFEIQPSENIVQNILFTDIFTIPLITFNSGATFWPIHLQTMKWGSCFGNNILCVFFTLSFKISENLRYAFMSYQHIFQLLLSLLGIIWHAVVFCFSVSVGRFETLFRHSASLKILQIERLKGYHYLKYFQYHLDKTLRTAKGTTLWRSLPF